MRTTKSEQWRDRDSPSNSKRLRTTPRMHYLPLIGLGCVLLLRSVEALDSDEFVEWTKGRASALVRAAAAKPVDGTAHALAGGRKDRSAPRHRSRAPPPSE